MSPQPAPLPPPPRSFHVESDGLSLHLLERAPGAPHRVLLLHGYLDHGRGFDWMAERLPPTLHTVALDFRGMGASGHLGPGAHYHPMDHLADVEAVLDTLGWPQAHLVGHSLGGTVALTYAAARPGRVASVTAIEALGPSGGEPELAVRRLQGFVTDARRPPRRRVYASVEEAAQRLREGNPSLSDAAARHLAQHGTAPVSGAGAEEGGRVFTFDPRHRRRGAVGLDEQQTLAVLAAVACPVQVLRGSHGFTTSGGQLEARLAALRSPPVHSVPGGHHCHLDSPGEVAARVAAFVTRGG